MNKFLAVMFTAMFLWAGPALAKKPSGPSTHTATLNVKATGTSASGGEVGTDGQCNFDDWVNVCPSGTCECDQGASPSGSGSVNKGKTTVTDFWITIDTGINPATEPTVDGGPTPKCNLFFGVLTAAGTTTGETVTVNMIGTTCHHVTSKGVHDIDVLSGGWGISDDPAPSPNDASGWGTLSGTVNQSTNAILLKLSGDVTK
jgi:hypothetical protein